jgi:hypothetical protein
LKIKVKVKEGDFKECQVAEHVLKERKTKGGPSPETVKGEIKKFQRSLRQHREWVQEKGVQVKKARAEVKKMVKSLT